LDLSWKYSIRHSPPAPVMEARLGGFELELVVDTGFAGGVLIPFPLFESLGLLSTLSADSYRAVLPDSRRLRLFTAKEEVTVGKEKMVVEVHATPSIDRKLVGRSFLRSFVAVLDGGGEELELRGPVGRGSRKG